MSRGFRVAITYITRDGEVQVDELNPNGGFAQWEPPPQVEEVLSVTAMVVEELADGRLEPVRFKLGG